jgi:hypothetical protein
VYSFACAKIVALRFFGISLDTTSPASVREFISGKPTSRHVLRGVSGRIDSVSALSSSVSGLVSVIIVSSVLWLWS